MTDFHTLDEAFAEFERRADLETAANRSRTAHPTSHGAVRRTRPMLVAASVATVVAVSGGGVLLAEHHGSASGSTRAGGGTAPATSTPTGPADPTVTAVPPLLPSRSPSPTPTRSDTTAFPPDGPDELERQFRAVLQGTATITVEQTANQPGDPFIAGVLTTDEGAKGGYDIQILNYGRGTKADCSGDNGPCDLSTLPDGATLAVKTTPSRTARVKTYEMTLARADGTEFLFSLSNQTDTKGAGPVLGANPPLTVGQMSRILQSERW